MQKRCQLATGLRSHRRPRWHQPPLSPARQPTRRSCISIRPPSTCPPTIDMSTLAVMCACRARLDSGSCCCLPRDSRLRCSVLSRVGLRGRCSLQWQCTVCQTVGISHSQLPAIVDDEEPRRHASFFQGRQALHDACSSRGKGSSGLHGTMPMLYQRSKTRLCIYLAGVHIVHIQSPSAETLW